MPVLVAHTSAIGTSSGSTTPPVDTTGANIIFLIFAYYAVTGLPTISDSKGNTLTALTSYASASASIGISYCFNPTVGSGHTATSALATSFSPIALLAFSGALTSPFDQQNGNSSNPVSSPASLQTGSITPAGNGEIIISALAAHNAVTTPTVDSSLSIVEHQPFTNGLSWDLSVSYLIQGAAAAINPNWTITAAATGMAANVLAFKASVATTLFRRSKGNRSGSRSAA